MNSKLVATILISLGISNSAFAAFLGKGDAKALYDENCAACHGKSMEGGMADSLLNNKWNVPHLTKSSDNSNKSLEVSNQADLEKWIFKAIKEGVTDTSMPAWKQSLTDNQIRTLTLLILETRYLNKQKATPKVNLKKTFSSEKHSFKLEQIAKADSPLWALDFLPSGDLIFTERNGNLWHQKKDQISAKTSDQMELAKTKINHTLPVWHQDQGGLLDVIPDPDYKQNGWIYLSFSTATGKNNNGKTTGALQVVRGKIKSDEKIGLELSNSETIFLPPVSFHINRGWHFGSRFAFSGEHLFFSLGDEGYQDLAQDKSKYNGKIHRIYPDGKIPKDNPFVNSTKDIASIWTYGNRNPQGIAVHPNDKTIWSSEHGPRGGDEINLIKKGKNYGWPKVTYGMNYDGSPITSVTSLPNMVEPKLYWTPSIAVAGMEFYSGDKFKDWNNNLLVGSLALQELHRLEIVGDKVIADEILFSGLGRIRDVKNGPDGFPYLILNNKKTGNYGIFRLIPAI